MKEKKVTRKFLVEEFEDGSTRVTYNKDPNLAEGESSTIISEGMIFLAQHGEFFKKIVTGKAETIGRLIFGTYSHAVKLAARGELQEGHLAMIFEKVCEDIAKISRFRKMKGNPENILEQIETDTDPFGSFGSGISH